MSGREKIWYAGKVMWIDIPDDPEPPQAPDDRWPDLMLALETLTEKQRFVVECHYGLRGDPLSFQQIADLMGVSKQAVHQLVNRAIELMQELTETQRRVA